MLLIFWWQGVAALFWKFSEELRKFDDISMQRIEKFGDELMFLKRLHVLHPDGRMTLQVHRKHVNQLRSLLGMNPKTHNKRSLCHSDIDREDSNQDLSADACTVFRTCVGVLCIWQTTCLTASMSSDIFQHTARSRQQRA